MLWSWGVIIPSGAMLAVSAKKWLPPTAGVGPNWFVGHRALGYAGVAMATAGTFIGRAIATGGERADSHRLIGYAAALVGFAQPIIAYFRGSMTAEEKRRSGWYALHKYLGWLSLALGLANIRLGLKLWDPEQALSTAYSGGIVATGAITAAWNYKNLGLPMNPLGL